MLSGIIFVVGSIAAITLFGFGVNAVIGGIEATTRWENFLQ